MFTTPTNRLTRASLSFLNKSTTTPLATSYQTRSFSIKKFLNPFKYYQENADTAAKKRVQKELNSGIMWDVKEFTNNPNMKLFVGSPTAIALGKAKSIPSFKTSDLNGKTIEIPDDFPSNKPTLLIVSLKPFHSDVFVESWSKPFKSKFPNLECHSTILVHQLGYQIFSPLLKMSRKNKIDTVTESWSNQMPHIKESNDLYETFSITNIFGSYIFLVLDGKIRWQSSGKSTPEEIETLCKVTQTLIDNPNPLLESSKKTK
ncbi:hypothetical protein CYY_000861 [Polysphondylium violaceum]|uniref:Uncharacterized protein n=1 Tax=Polysphondylium violaceum TaxID=133409 RepID=A0A8J4QA37_9MYCE|nr:hypothetical protein CYY_000861 [Polysphondylium violaceum]